MNNVFEPWIWYTVDFTGAKDYREVYKIIKRDLEFPDYFGENLDAFWDCLTDMITEQPFITVKGVKSLPKRLQRDMTDIMRLFRRAEEVYPQYIRVVFEE